MKLPLDEYEDLCDVEEACRNFCDALDYALKPDKWGELSQAMRDALEKIAPVSGENYLKRLKEADDSISI